jgi:hypothetical protein
LTLTGHEVNLIAEWGGAIKAIEIKMSTTFQPDLVKSVNYFNTLSPHSERYLIYMGNEEGTYLNNFLVPLRKIHNFLYT